MWFHMYGLHLSNKAVDFEYIGCCSFTPWLCCSRTPWAGRAMDSTVQPMMSESTTLHPEPRLLWIHLNRGCKYGFINGDVNTLWSMTEWSQLLMALNYNLFIPFFWTGALEPWGWSWFVNGGGIVIRLCTVKAYCNYLKGIIWIWLYCLDLDKAKLFIRHVPWFLSLYNVQKSKFSSSCWPAGITLFRWSTYQWPFVGRWCHTSQWITSLLYHLNKCF